LEVQSLALGLDEGCPYHLAQFGDSTALPDAEAHLAQSRIDGDRRRRLQQLGCAAGALQRAGETLPAVGWRRQPPGPRLGPAGDADGRVGTPLKPTIGLPPGGGVAQDGEGHAHRSVLKATARAWAAARSS